jgi:hypothetical protein
MQDPFTGRETCLKGRALPSPAERNRLLNDHGRRLEALARLSACAAQCGIAEDPDRDIVTLPEDQLSLLELGDSHWAELSHAIREWRKLIPLLLLEDFGFPANAENPLEEPNSRLHRIGGGVEAWAYASPSEGTVYKFYRPAEGTDKKIGSAFAFRGGDETDFVAEARAGSYRELLEKLLLVDALAGMPTEVVAVTPEGILIAKQILGDTIPQGDDVSQFLPPALIEIPSRFLRANRDHPRLFFFGDTPFLVADLHARNFVKDPTGTLRVIDLVGSVWPKETLERVPGIAAWIDRVRQNPLAGALPDSPDDEL